MEKVTGVGGLFFRANDPSALARWYEAHLGVPKTLETYDESPWQQGAGPMVFAPFPADTNYFGSAEQQGMINFRVSHLAAMVAQLRGAGIEVEVDRDEYPNGHFARFLHK